MPQRHLARECVSHFADRLFVVRVRQVPCSHQLLRPYPPPALADDMPNKPNAKRCHLGLPTARWSLQATIRRYPGS